MLASCAVEQAAGGRSGLHPQAGLIREQEGEQSKQGAQGLPPSTPCDASPGRQERLVQYRQSGATLPQPPPPPAGGGVGRLVAVTSVVSGGAQRSLVHLSSQTIPVLTLLLHFVTLCYLYLPYV